MFGIILTTHYNVGISLKIITKDVSLIIINESSNNECNKTKNNCDIILSHNNLQRNILKTVIYYSNKYFGGFRLIFIDALPKLIDTEKETTPNILGVYPQDQSVETKSRRIWTHF